MLKEKLKQLVSACFTGIWIETFEFQESIREITEILWLLFERSRN